MIFALVLRFVYFFCLSILILNFGFAFGIFVLFCVVVIVSNDNVDNLTLLSCVASISTVNGFLSRYFFSSYVLASMYHVSLDETMSIAVYFFMFCSFFFVHSSALVASYFRHNDCHQ